ncbi:MAG: threonine ammonia-lyase [Bacillota bacterium]
MSGPEPSAAGLPGADLREPDLTDVLSARRIIDRYLHRTPLLNPGDLCELLGADVYVKCENLQPIGAFKVRGGINLGYRLTPEERSGGLVTASTGNHGQSIAYAARTFGVKATIYAPEGANSVKVASMQRLGAEVVLHGKDFDDSRTRAEEEAAAKKARFVSSGDEPLLIAGVGTATLEVLEEVPDLDYLFVPVGGGSGASGAAIAAKGINPKIKVIGVQSSGAPAVYESWKARRPVSLGRPQTFADGLATRAPFLLPLKIMTRLLDDMVLVSEDELREAVVMYVEHARLIAEGAGAAALAAARKLAPTIKGKKVGLILSGGNLPIDLLRSILAG